MATQTVEFRSPPSQTITAKLFAVGSDTQVASVSTTEATNRKGTYSAAYTDVAAGEYELIALVGSVPVARWFVTLTLTTATFQAYDKSRAELDSATQTQITEIKAKTDNLPSDPADQSLIIAATDAVMARLGAPAGASMSADIASVKTDTGTTLPAQIAGISGGSGSGARTVTITVNDGTTVLQNALIRLTEGANTFTATTNTSGVATFNVDDATYTVAITKSGYSYAGTTLVVDGAETRTYSMTQVSVTPPTDPANSLLVITCRTPSGVAESGVVISVRKKTVASGDVNNAYSGAVMTDTSGGDGVTSFKVVRNAVYQYKRGTADVWTDITIEDADATEAVSIVGSRY